jgi:hypothetical protein
MQNVQHRSIAASAEEVGALVDQTGTPDDHIWPAPPWSPIVLDAGLTPGSRGGHGPIRYTVSAYEPGRRVRFSFDPGLGLVGYHELLVTSQGAGNCQLTHTISGRLEGRMRLLWPLMIRWLHEALLQDLLDNAERAATGRLSGPPARWSVWVRLLRRVIGRSAVPAGASPGAAG